MIKLKSVSSLVLVFIIVVYLLAFGYFKTWNNQILTQGDTWGYYAYLPSIFLLHDINSNLELNYTTRKKYYTGNIIDKGNDLPNGKRMIKYTMGVALFELPFFAIATLVAYTFGWAADGFSTPYHIAIAISVLFYAILSIWLLRRVLRYYFSENITALTLLLVGLATNLFYFSTYNLGMSHSFLFCLYVVLLYSTIKWFATNKWKYALLIGLCCCWINLIRPVELICVLFPLLYGIVSFKDIPKRLIHIKQHWQAYLAALATFVLINVPQLIYWKLQTGTWLYYSYQGESFDFKHPHIWEGMLGANNGWLIYTPVMVFALFGLVSLWQRGNAFRLPIVLFLPIHIYVIYSWWCWNYINGYGSRPMVETYAFLSLPLAACMSSLLNSNLLKSLLVPILLFCTWHNIFTTYQYTLGIAWSQDSTYAYWLSTLGKTKLNVTDIIYYDTNDWQPDTTQIQLVSTLYKNTFNDSTSTNLSQTVKLGKEAYHVTEEFSPFGLDTIVGKTNLRKGDYLKITIDAFTDNASSDYYRMNLLTTTLLHNNKSYKWEGIRLENKINNNNTIWNVNTGQWGTIVFFIHVNEDIEPTDVLQVYNWNPHKREIFVANMEVSLWRSKDKNN